MPELSSFRFEQQMAKVHGKSDVFPRRPTEKVRKLKDYPKFGTLIGQRDVKYFCLYMDSRDRIYYQKRETNPKVIGTVDAHGNETKKMRQFAPNSINFAKVLRRFREPPIESNRTNADTRTGFKMGSDYLVKAFFTFGQRSVPPGFVHVIQTLDVPMLFYLRPKNCADRVKDGLFPTKSLFQYDRRILEPRTRYRVPSGIVYVLFCVQKTFFRLDLVKEKTEIPFPCIDPVRHRVTKINDPYEDPVQTPFIEDQNREETDATYMDITFPSTCSHSSFEQQQQQSSFEQQPQPSFDFTFPSTCSQSSFEQQQQQSSLEQQQQSSLEQQQQSSLEQQQQSSFEQQQQSSFEQQQQPPVSSQQQPFFEQQQSPVFSQPLSEQSVFSESQQQQQQPTTYIWIQNSLPAVREIVRVKEKDFASTYRRLTKREMADPREKIPENPDWDPEPLDLTTVQLVNFTASEQPVDLSAKQRIMDFDDLDAMELEDIRLNPAVNKIIEDLQSFSQDDIL